MIEQIEEKLSGKIPVSRLELFELIDSWGRNANITINDDEGSVYIDEGKPSNKYDLSKLDTSEITNMSFLFCFSDFEGDISKWDTSNVTRMDYMFQRANMFISEVNDWDVSNVTKMDAIFSYTSSFDKSIDKWNINDSNSFEYAFVEAYAFINRFNNGAELPENTKGFKIWFDDNKENMKSIDVNKKLELDSFFESIKQQTLSMSMG